jgi:hypothetical protein
MLPLVQQGIALDAAASPRAAAAGRGRLLATYLAAVTGDARVVS